MTNFDQYAAYYDLLYRDKDYAGEARFVRELLSQYTPTASSILELGCGTGIHALWLAEHGYDVHGIDLSPSMIEKAKQRLEGSDSGSRLNFSVGDVRAVRADRSFDAVIALFHVVSYQSTNADVVATFESASRHLEPGGVFIFDFWFGPAVLVQKPEVRVKRMDSASHKILRIAEPTLDVAECLCDVDYTVFVSGADDVAGEPIHERHRMRYFFLPEFRVLAAAAGLDLEASFEWMTRHVPSTDTWSVCVVARKCE